MKTDQYDLHRSHYKLLLTGFLLVNLAAFSTTASASNGMALENDSMTMTNMKMKHPSPQHLPASSLPASPMSSVTQLNGMVMPPGMIMVPGLSMDQMKDMSAVDFSKITFTALPDARGDQLLVPEIVNGVKIFHLNAAIIQWNILPNLPVVGYAFNGQIPGPRIHITEGDRVRIIVKNDLPESTSLHWHGLIVPNQYDGPAGVTQPAIPPGGSYAYEFTAKQHGTYFYHSHELADRQQTLGMYGAFIIDPKAKEDLPAYNHDVVIQLQEWLVKQGYTFPPMPMEGFLPNFFTINGKAYPATETIHAKVGEKIRFRLIGTNNVGIHPMHIHGGPFTVIAIDGNTLPPLAREERDTVNVGPGQRYDVIWPAREKGKWLLHCHIAHHTTNDNKEEQGGGGLTMIIQVD